MILALRKCPVGIFSVRQQLAAGVKWLLNEESMTREEERKAFKIAGPARKWETGAIPRERIITIDGRYPGMLLNWTGNPLYRNWISVNIWTGIYIELKHGQTIQDALGNITEQQYDEKVNYMLNHRKPQNVRLCFDVQIKEPSGVLVSYTFDLFKKILFPEI